MKKSTKFVLFATLAILASSPLVYAVLSRTQTINYTLVSTSSATVQIISLGQLVGGATGSQTFQNTVGITEQSSGTHTVTLTLGAINGTLFNKFIVDYLFNGSNLCTLASNSNTCSFSLSFTAGTTAYLSTTVSYGVNDGFSTTGSATVTIAVA